jgi:hypothetical protein
VREEELLIVEITALTTEEELLIVEITALTAEGENSERVSQLASLYNRELVPSSREVRTKGKNQEIKASSSHHFYSPRSSSEPRWACVLKATHASSFWFRITIPTNWDRGHVLQQMQPVFPDTLSKEVQFIFIEKSLRMMFGS